MKKVEIERMQRLEDLVERQKKEIETITYAKRLVEQDFLKLQGANEALTELIVRLKKGE